MENKTLHLYRPGAIGDIIMTLQVIEKYKKLNPDTKIIYYCAPQYSDVASLSTAVDEVRSSLDYDNKLPGAINLVGYTETPLKHHLMWYFGKELGMNDSFDTYGFTPNFKPSTNALFNSLIAEQQHNFITIHCNAGWSPYKNWNMNKWQEVVDRIRDHDIIQIGVKGEPVLHNVIDMTGHLTLSESIRLIKKARFHLGVDSFSNHATALLPYTPSVILWGSTHPMIFGYGHNINIWKPLKCSPCYRIYDWISKNPTGKCPLDKLQSWETPEHPCMSSITVDEVYNAFKKILTK